MHPSQYEFTRLSPVPGGPPPPSELRRRGMSTRSARRNVTRAQPLPSERDRDSDDDPTSLPHTDALFESLIPAGIIRHGTGDDRQLRAAQFFRGSVNTKMVASASAISSLESVDINTLAEGERSTFSLPTFCYVRQPHVNFY